MRLCKDCDYYNEYAMSCRHPQATKRAWIDEFTGTMRVTTYWVDEMRSEEDLCGINARLFEKIKTHSMDTLTFYFGLAILSVCLVIALQTFC